MSSTIKRVCAWCHKDLGEVRSPGSNEYPITHGICDSCVKKYFSRPGTDLQGYLDRFKLPVLMVNEQRQVLLANRHAYNLLGKSLEEIRGYRGGDVFECTYAKLPEGCGNTIHCKTCTIRNTVLDTFKTGRSATRVPAYADLEVDKAVKTTRFLISTEKVKEIVLLRIDEIHAGK